METKDKPRKPMPIYYHGKTSCNRKAKEVKKDADKPKREERDPEA